MNDDENLKDCESLSKEELMERLQDAEMVMKKLFQRNKELESQVENKENFEECKNCDKLREEHKLKETEWKEELEKLKKPKVDSSFEDYKEYMGERLAVTMAEAKRHFANYVEVRNQFDSFMESRIGQVSGGSKGSKINNDILNTLKRQL